MSSETALLQAVLAHPLDGDVRCIYADWLEDRGDPRGEFLRVQSALAHPPENYEARVALHIRDRQLRETIELAWIRQLGYADTPTPLVDLQVPRRVIDLLSVLAAVNHQATPLLQRGEELVVALAEPSAGAVRELRQETGCRITTTPVWENEAADAAAAYYAAWPPGGGGAPVVVAAAVETSEALRTSTLASEWLRTLLREALRQGADLISLEPLDRAFRIRFQCQGVWREFDTPPPQIGYNLTAEVKRLANLEVDDSSTPHRGEIEMLLDKRPLRMQVETLPTAGGERVRIHPTRTRLLNEAEQA
ncbi:ATPase, T2SS/T4P/T4SS family [Lignipirellula cremea]|nr:ATPase, T2SS/T4P/T4SS family [Lignipirellula cremea]